MHSKAGASLYFLSSLSLYLSFPYLSTLKGSLVFGFALALLLLDPILSSLAPTPHASQKKKSSQLFLVWGFGLASLVFYLSRFYIEVPLDKLGGSDASLLGRLRTLLLFLFLGSYIISLVYRFLYNLSLVSNFRVANNSYQDSHQKQRQKYLQENISSILAMLAVFIFINYLSHIQNPSLDLSPGYYSFQESSISVIRSINKTDKEIQVHAFLPDLQAVKLRRSGFTSPEIYKITNDIRLLLEQLPTISSRIKLNFYNADIDSFDSNEFGKISNGTIVFRSPKKLNNSLDLKEKLYIERKIYARTKEKLNMLEKDIVKALLYIASPRKTVYFTASNGERASLTTGALNQAFGIKSLKEQFRFYNIKLKSLNHKNSWPSDEALPKDADVIAIIAPTVPFGKNAQKKLLEYLRNGGALFITIDAQSNSENFTWLFENLGDTRGKSTQFIANALTNTSLSNVLLVDGFEKHPINESLLNIPASSIVLPQHGYFEQLTIKKPQEESRKESQKKAKEKKREETRGKNQKENRENSQVKPQNLSDKRQAIKNLFEMKGKVLLYSPYNSFVDANANKRKDKGEISGRKPLAIAYQKINFATSPKLVIFSGTDWLSERGLSFPILKKNFLLASDSMLWLLENPITASFTPHERPTINANLTDDLKWKLVLFGMFFFPFGIAICLGLAIFYYRKKYMIKIN